MKITEDVSPVRDDIDLSCVQSKYSRDEQKIIDTALSIMDSKIKGSSPMTSSSEVKDYLKLKLRDEEREIFSVLLLDSGHEVIRYQPLFYGTLDKSAVYPREIVKSVICANAAAVILVHNHPSGRSNPSESDKHITNKVKEALDLIDVRVLDHFIVGNAIVSFTEQGLL